MDKKFYFSKKYLELKEKATALSKEGNPVRFHKMETDIEKLIEELDISYMELELQNQAIKEAQQQLEVSRIYYNELFNYSPIGYMILDTSCIIKEINLQASKILDLDIQNLLGLRLHMFISVKDFIAYDKCLQGLLTENIQQSCDIQIKTNLNNKKWVRLGFIKHDTVQHKKPKILASIMDISKEKEAESILKENNYLLEKLVQERTYDLKKAREHAEALSKTKDQFLSNMSHEIRTPMNGIVGMVQMLQNTELSPQQQEYIQTINGSCESLMTIINDILDLSKVEAGKLTLSSDPLDIRSVIDNVIKVMSSRAYEKQLEFASIISSQIPMYLYGDSVRIGQILLNLLSNAIKFTDSGEIVLSATMIKKTRDIASIRFEILDTGIGIPESQKYVIFEPFSQIHERKLMNIGTGLGLAISKKIAQMMGGDINFESIYKKGTRFWATVQLKICDNQAQDFPVKKFETYRILLVESYHNRRTVFREHLNLLNMIFDETSSAIRGQMMITEAVKNNQPYDFCFVNPNMQIDENLLFWQWLEKQQGLKSTRFIAIIPFIDTTAMYGDLFFDHILLPVTWSGLCRIFEQLENKKAHQINPIHTNHGSKEANKNKQILIVEDDIVNQQVLKGILENDNYQVIIADHGKHALEILKNTYCDLILMDMLMPELNGIETTKIIRNNRSETINHNVPIIAMTANAMDIHRDSCFEAGMNDFLTKPVKIKHIRSTINKWLYPDQQEDQSEFIHDYNSEQIPKLYDRDEIIDRLEGNMPLVAETIKLFLQNVPKLLESLKKAIAIGDVMDMEIRAHTIKGNAINIGAKSLKGLAIKMENAARKGNIQQAEALITPLEQMINRINQQLAYEPT